LQTRRRGAENSFAYARRVENEEQENRRARIGTERREDAYLTGINKGKLHEINGTKDVFINNSVTFQANEVGNKIKRRIDLLSPRSPVGIDEGS
jgi:hypothetical protein